MLDRLDLIVRIAAATELLLLAGLLLRDRPRARLTWFFLPLAVCLCGFLNGNTPEPSLVIGGGVGWGAHLISGFAAVFLWWFCLSLFDRSFRLRGLPLVAGLVWLAIAGADRGVLGAQIAGRGLSWVLVVLGLGIVGHIGWRLVRDREGDLLEARRRARVLVAAFLALLLLTDLGVDLLFGFGWRPAGFALAQNTAILAFGLWLGALLLRVSGTEAGAVASITPTSTHAAAAGSPPRDEPDVRLIERLRVLMEVERVHLDPGLTFADFVRRAGAPERTVRALINHQLGHDHFRSFLNAHRVKEACRRLSDPERQADKLAAIAFDSGFASLASFNRAFRDIQGCAPSAYRSDSLASAATRTTEIPSGHDPAFEEPFAGS